MVLPFAGLSSLLSVLFTYESLQPIFGFFYFIIIKVIEQNYNPHRPNSATPKYNQVNFMKSSWEGMVGAGKATFCLGWVLGDW